jgi:outer membrane protein assembly factor BamB
MIRPAGYYLLALLIVLPAPGEDWPEWRGKGRIGVWKEDEILENFPAKGLTPAWRTPLNAGFAGPAVAAGRVFVTDFRKSAGLKGTERALALDEKTGRMLWTREWPANYGGIGYAYGPRATPTVDGDRVYIAGAAGALLCLNAATGAVIWQKDYVKDYQMEMPTWGVSSAPVIYRNHAIAIVGGKPDAKVVAFDKMTGKEIWRSLESSSEQGYSQPVIIEAGGVTQLIIWHPRAIASLNPDNGSVYWEQEFNIHMGMTLATPVLSGSRLLVSSFYNGSMLLDLLGRRAAMLWRGRSQSEIDTDGLHAVVNTPVIDGNYIYGICSYGQFRCLRLDTGQRVWETLDVTREKARWASGFIVRHRDRYFINNDRGELIIARLSPDGYREIGRTHLIRPTSGSGNRRVLGAVNWTHPAYANGHILTRNDEEILSVPLQRGR